MPKQEITLKGLDGHEEHLVYDAADGQMSGSLEDCARSLFPAEGETTPRLRFQGFEGEWEKKNFAKVFLFLSNNSLSRAELNEQEGCVYNVHYGDVLIKFGEIIDLRKDCLPYISSPYLSKELIKRGTLQNGDIVFTDAAEDSTVGKCSEIITVGNEKIVSGLHTIPCRPLSTIHKTYENYQL